MSDHHDPMPDLDRAARAAAGGLRDHVAHQLDVHPLAAASPRRSRVGGLSRAALVVAVLALVAVSAVAIGGRDDDGPTPDVDRDLPTPIALTPLGPTDGKASIGLPVTVEPSTGLTHGDTVTATGSGFRPEVNVAIVQCAIEAGRPAKGGEAAGVDGCDIAEYTSIYATSDGIATGEFRVKDHITTPATGPVDCTIELGRCIIAMAEVSDYDRSGGYGIGFGAEAPEAPVPTLAVDPAVGLSDAQVVHVTGTDLAPGPIDLQVCSVDPAVCWTTGSLEAPAAPLTVDETGALDVEVPAWRFLPGPSPRTYVDCAVSACNLVATTADGTEPIPVRLGFLSGGPAPTGPAVVVVPNADVSPGSLVAVRGAGFEAGTSIALSFCISPPGEAPASGVCIDLAHEPYRIGADGVLDHSTGVPPTQDLGDYALAEPGDEAATDGAEATTTTIPPTWPCDGVASGCVVLVTLTYGDDPAGLLRPRFTPDPAPLTYRRPT